LKLISTKEANGEFLHLLEIFTGEIYD